MSMVLEDVKEKDKNRGGEVKRSRRGPKPRGNVKIEWSPSFAYAIGLITTDGNLSPDGRHITLVSKEKEQLENFLHCLCLKNKIGRNISGNGKEVFRVQFGDVLFYRFLRSIGIHPNKTKTIGVLDIPHKFAFDFLRGHLDGDGSFYSYRDKRWKSSYMFYTSFVSASREHIEWVQKVLFRALCIKGHITKGIRSSVYQLKYAKAESLKLLPKLYYDREVVCLSRKRIKIEKAVLAIGGCEI